MASISSDDCKTFLENHFHYPAKEWKRASKKKDATGRVLREFVHAVVGNVILADSPNMHIAAQTFSAPSKVQMPAYLLPQAPLQLGPWNLVQHEFDLAASVKAQCLFDNAVDHSSVTLDTSSAGYDAMPSLFEFYFVDDADEQYDVIKAINKAKDSNSIVAGLKVFITTRHRFYGCNHLSWAIKSFLPKFFEETEESTFAIYEKWSYVYDADRQAAVDNGTIAQVGLMEVMRDLSGRGFRYAPKHCVFSKLMKQGQTYCA